MTSTSEIGASGKTPHIVLLLSCFYVFCLSRDALTSPIKMKLFCIQQQEKTKRKLRDIDINVSVHMSRYVLEQRCQHHVQLAWTADWGAACPAGQGDGFST